MFDAFSVAEAVLPSRPGDQAAEVRIFHPPSDDTKINRALLADGCVRAFDVCCVSSSSGHKSVRMAPSDISGGAVPPGVIDFSSLDVCVERT